MAMPGHSPTFNGPSSPPRSYNGYSEPQPPPSMYGPPARPIMLPPSPQHFPPRYSQPPLPAPSPAIAPNNGPPPPYKRPGSSMSISSMLGTEPEKPAHEQYNTHNVPSRPPTGQSSHSGPSMSLGAVMSPPQYPSKPNPSDYSYKPRSKTPERAAGTPLGQRPHRSSSGSISQRPGLPYDPQPRPGPPPSNMNSYPDPRYTPPFGPTVVPKDEFDDRSRRTSLSGILQRPESQPQPNTITSAFSSVSNPPVRPESIPPSLAQMDRPIQTPMNGPEHPRSNGHVGSYDTRPPSLSTLPRFPQTAPVPQPVPIPAPLERLPAASLSPEMRRPQLNGNENRGLAGILNQQSDPVLGAPNMMRQDSVQSQSDRSVLGDRLRNSRAYSPFAGSVASQNLSTASGPLDDRARKGSEELSQHRAILGLANESKRGRYSPLPQAVQGAQAQTPVPDAGIKNEHGRVFAGIGSGMGSASAGPTPTPQPLPASPFKQNEGAARLSEENLIKMSRSTSGISKRNRKALDEDVRAESDVGEVKRSGPGRGKRSKYQHSYKLDLEDPPLGHRKNGAFPTSNPAPRSATPTSGNSHLQRQPSERSPVFRPKKIIKITSVVALARRNPRRHLGFFKYDPEVGPVDLNRPSNPKFDVSIRPNLLPSFTEAEHINCTYTVRVPRVWLQQKERGLICAERYLWGSGIYTDDSDPVAAAMHSGFIPSVHPAGIDEALLERVIQEQNPRIEGLVAPAKPKPVEENKDLHITLVVLPQLESYVESVRFGIKSRSWPDAPVDPSNPTTDTNTTPHDGVSFMVLKAEFVDDGAEVKRVGRTGKEKRERLRRELMDRKRGFELEKEKLALAAARAKERKDAMKRKGHKGLATPDSLESKDKSGSADGTAKKGTPLNPTRASVEGDRNAEEIMRLDGVGQSPESWINQLKDVAATA